MFHQTFIWLIIASIMVRIVPLRWFNYILGKFNKIEETELNWFQTEIIKLALKNMRRWKRYLPWRVKCFEEAIVIKKVLEKYKIRSTLFLGVNKNEKKELIAHAWLKTGSQIVAGDKGINKFVVVGFYT